MKLHQLFEEFYVGKDHQHKDEDRFYVYDTLATDRWKPLAGPFPSEEEAEGALKKLGAEEGRKQAEFYKTNRGMMPGRVHRDNR